MRTLRRSSLPRVVAVLLLVLVLVTPCVGHATFPVPLTARPVTPLTLSNLGMQDGFEIVFGDETGLIHVLGGDGNPFAGWPIDIGNLPFNGSIAVADIDLDGQPEIVTGNTNGDVVAFHVDGTTLPGFPKSLFPGKSVFVSLADIAGDIRLEIVACAGNRVYALDPSGTVKPGFPTFVNVGFDLNCPAALGDVDGDGHRDIVVLAADNVRWFRGDGTLGDIGFFAGESFTDPPALADVDANGDLEIAIASDQGRIHLLDHTLVDRAGWPLVLAGSPPANGVVFGKLNPAHDVSLSFTTWAGTAYEVSVAGLIYAGFPEFYPSIALTCSPAVVELDAQGSARELTYGTP